MSALILSGIHVKPMRSFVKTSFLSRCNVRPKNVRIFLFDAVFDRSLDYVVRVCTTLERDLFKHAPHELTGRCVRLQM